ncbi:MAG TPA: hypothetical protein VLX92_29085 [Kofleriaceae bacterium]|nr:hypothetical protein [Kofleriaceae bacterium]
MLRSLLPLTFLAAVAAGASGCYTADADVGVAYAAPGPDLVDVSPGVQVIADYDYPVFFTGGLYWRSYGGFWYSSPYWNRGWAVNYHAPIAIRSIARPWAYAHYRPVGWHGRGYVGARPVYRGGGRAYVAPHAGHVAVRGHARH